MLQKIFSFVAETAVGFHTVADAYPQHPASTSSLRDRDLGVEKQVNPSLLASSPKKTPAPCNNPLRRTSSAQDIDVKVVTPVTPVTSKTRRRRSNSGNVNPGNQQQQRRLQSKSLLQTTRNLLLKMDGSESSRIHLIVSQLVNVSIQPIRDHVEKPAKSPPNQH